MADRIGGVRRVIGITVVTHGASGAIEALQSMPAEYQKYMKKALKRAEEAMKKAAIEETRSLYYVTVSQLKGEITVKSRKDNVLLVVRGKRHPLYRFKMSPKRPPKDGKPYTVKGAVRRDGGLKPIMQGQHNKPFLMPIQGGANYLAVVREGRPRLPVTPIISPAYSQLVRWAENHEHLIEEQTREAIAKVFYEWIGGTEKEIAKVEKGDTVS